jgi:hypothetical protein
VAQCRGDLKCEDSVTNQHLVEMIQEYRELELKVKRGESLSPGSEESNVDLSFG